MGLQSILVRATSLLGFLALLAEPGAAGSLETSMASSRLICADGKDVIAFDRSAGRMWIAKSAEAQKNRGFELNEVSISAGTNDDFTFSGRFVMDSPHSSIDQIFSGRMKSKRLELNSDPRPPAARKPFSCTAR